MMARVAPWVPLALLLAQHGPLMTGCGTTLPSLLTALPLCCASTNPHPTSAVVASLSHPSSTLLPPILFHVHRYVDGGTALSGTFASLTAQAVDTMDAPSVFMCGHPPTGWSSPTAIAGFVGSVDNVRAVPTLQLPLPAACQFR